MVVLSLVVFLDADLGLFSLFLGVFPNFQLTVLKTIWVDGSLTAAMVRRRKKIVQFSADCAIRTILI